MSIFAIMVGLVAQVQVAPSVAELVDPVLDDIGYPDRLAEQPIHLDLDATVAAFGQSVVDSAYLRIEDLAARHRDDERLRPGKKSEVIKCAEVRDHFRQCEVEDGGVFVKIVEAVPSSESQPGVVRVVVQVRWADHNDLLRGYDMELFLGKDPDTGGVWKVVDRGAAIVL